MATKKEQAMPTGFLTETEEDKNAERNKQRKLDNQQSQEGRGVPDPKGKGSRWRETERPHAKSIHFDETLHQKINLLKHLTNTPVEDIIYDIIHEWFDNHFEDKKKELLGQL